LILVNTRARLPRDAGFLQIHGATRQEVLDSVLIAYRLAEIQARIDAYWRAVLPQ
jgi:hypothetical protein